MPRRVIDGDSIARSRKLKEVQPPQFRAELPLLITRATSNGTFVADPEGIWCDVYSYNREDVTREMIPKILDEYERVKILFRWVAPEDGKTWGYWVNIDQPGRLPGESRRGTHEKVGPPVPQDQLAAFLGSRTLPNGNGGFPNGNEPFLGIGIGSGFGVGIGKGAGTGIASGIQPSATTTAPFYTGANSESPKGSTNTENNTAALPTAQAPLTRAVANTSLPTALQRSTPVSVEEIVDAYPMTPTNEYVRRGWLARTEEEVLSLVHTGRFTTSQDARDFLLDRVERYAASKPDRTYSLKSFFAQEVYAKAWLDRDDVTRAVEALRATFRGKNGVAAAEQDDEEQADSAEQLWDEGESEQEVEDEQETEAEHDEESRYWPD